jgi:hypothetical protein
MTAAGANGRPAPRAAAADAKPGIKPDMDEAERFLGALDPTAGEFTFQTSDDDKARRKARAAGNKARKTKIPDPYAQILHGTLAQHWKRLVEMHGKRAGIFVTINATNLRGRTIKDVVKVRAVSWIWTARHSNRCWPTIRLHTSWSSRRLKSFTPTGASRTLHSTNSQRSKRC